MVEIANSSSIERHKSKQVHRSVQTQKHTLPPLHTQQLTNILWSYTRKCTRFITQIPEERVSAADITCNT